MKIHAYIKASVTDTQDSYNQRLLIDEYTKNQDLEICYYEDIESENVPEFQQLMNNLNEGDIIIATKLDRLVQTIKAGLAFRHHLIKKKILLICLDFSGDFLEDKSLEIFIELLCEFERKTKPLSEKISEGMSSSENMRSRPPFGWKFVGKGLDYEEVPEQQKVIKKILSLWNAGNHDSKYGIIAKKLNEDGDNLILSLNKIKPTKNKFYAETVKRIINFNN